MKAGDHLLELAQGMRLVVGIARIRRKKPDTVVAPVVRETLFQQVAVIEGEMYRQQLHRGYAKLLDVLDNWLSAKACIGTTEVLLQPRESLGEALYVEFIKNRVVKRQAKLAQQTLPTPIEFGVDHRAFGHKRGAVPLIEGGVIH